MSRVVNRDFVFGDEEREAFRMFMRMYENFSGCRVLSYCVMSNHFHLLLEVTPVPECGVSDQLLLERMRALYGEKHVEGVRLELASAREEERKMECFGAAEDEDVVLRSDEIREPYVKRMHDLTLFMKGLILRFTRWFNRKHERCGTLWEDRFKSVLMESGTAARTMAAYIDLNPVRAGMVNDPAKYRWSSYGEAVGGGTKGYGKKSREGLVRACMSHRGAGFGAERWKEVSRIYRRAMGLALGRKFLNAKVVRSGKKASVSKNDAELLESEDNETMLPDIDTGAMLRHRIRYFTDGLVIGSK